MILTWSVPPPEDDEGVPPHAVSATASVAPIAQVMTVFFDMILLDVLLDMCARWELAVSSGSGRRVHSGQLRGAPGQHATLEHGDGGLGDQGDYRHDHHRAEDTVHVEVV